MPPAWHDLHRQGRQRQSQHFNPRATCVARRVADWVMFCFNIFQSTCHLRGTTAKTNTKSGYTNKNQDTITNFIQKNISNTETPMKISFFLQILGANPPGKSCSLAIRTFFYLYGIARQHLNHSALSAYFLAYFLINPASSSIGMGAPIR